MTLAKLLLELNRRTASLRAKRGRRPALQAAQREMLILAKPGIERDRISAIFAELARADDPKRHGRRMFELLALEAVFKLDRK